MPEKQNRLAYIDWLRGFACVTMFEIHGYDAWLGGSARQETVAGLSRFSGTLAAPLFIFLAGVSCALVANRMERQGAGATQVALRIIRRGAEILALGLLFRIQEYVLGLPSAPRTDLLRVDVLNLIGVTIMLIGMSCWLAYKARSRAFVGAGIALAIALASPLIWTNLRPTWLPWFLESYVDGVHNLGVPQPWLFPIFPWAAFGFAGLTVGSVILQSDWIANGARTAALFSFGGIGLFGLSLLLDHSSIQLYSVYDYWHTSPNFFLARIGIVLALLFAAFVWCRWGWAVKGFSPLIELGQTSLLVYWVHIEFVYGRFSLLQRNAQTVPAATAGFLAICALMVLLAALRNRTKGQVLPWLKRHLYSRLSTGSAPEAENG